MFLGNFLQDRFFQTLQPVPRETAYPERVDTPPIRMFREVVFVKQYDPRLLGRVLSEPLRFRSAAVDHLQEKVRAGEGFLGARDTFQLDLVRRLAQPGGIEQTNRDAAQIDYFFDGVAGGPGLFADNGAFV